RSISSTVTLSRRSKPAEPPTTTDSWIFLDRTNMVRPPLSDRPSRAGAAEKKPTRPDSMRYIRPRRLTRQQAPRHGRVAFQLVIRQYPIERPPPGPANSHQRTHCTARGR